MQRKNFSQQQEQWSKFNKRKSQTALMEATVDIRAIAAFDLSEIG